MLCRHDGRLGDEHLAALVRTHHSAEQPLLEVHLSARGPERARVVHDNVAVEIERSRALQLCRGIARIAPDGGVSRHREGISPNVERAGLHVQRLRPRYREVILQRDRLREIAIAIVDVDMRPRVPSRGQVGLPVKDDGRVRCEVAQGCAGEGDVRQVEITSDTEPRRRV